MAQEYRNVASCSWGDHLDFGEGDGKLDTPARLERRVAAWHDELGAGKILWRDMRNFFNHYLTFTALGATPHPYVAPAMDELEVLLAAAHARGMQVYLYVDMLSEGWPLFPPEVRAVSHHNPYHGKDIAAQSRFTAAHPEYLMVDRAGVERHYGVMCYAYPEVRSYKLARYQELLAGYPFDGLFICTRSESKPVDYADQFGFNEPIVEEFQRRYGINILKEDFDLDAWRRLLGEYLTQFLRDVKMYLRTRDLRLSVGIPRGQVIGPPNGNITLDWRRWIAEGIVDELVIDQRQRVCPSTWLLLWPMHDGYGYVQNYFTGLHMPPLAQDIAESYGPFCAERQAQLYLARMWHTFDRSEEARLSALPGVSGLVFSTFRWDNQGVVARDNWYLRDDPHYQTVP